MSRDNESESEIDYLFGIIDGTVNHWNESWNQEPKEFHRSLALQYAFEQLEGVNNNSVQERLLKYIGGVEEYSPEYFGALRTLGYIGDGNIAELLIKRLSAKNPDIRFICLCSLGELLKRSVLENVDYIFTVNKMIALIVDNQASNEEIYECVRTLKHVNNDRAKNAIATALGNRLKHMPELQEIVRNT